MAGCWGSTKGSFFLNAGKTVRQKRPQGQVCQVCSGARNRRCKPNGLLAQVRVPEMESCFIFVSHRSLRIDGSVNLGGNCRYDQRCHRQDGYRCFINVIIHDKHRSRRRANGLQFTQPLKHP